MKLLIDRIACKKRDAVDNETGAPPVLRSNVDARSKLDAAKTSKPLAAIAEEFGLTGSHHSPMKTDLPALNAAGCVKKSLPNTPIAAGAATKPFKVLKRTRPRLQGPRGKKMNQRSAED